MAKAKTKVLSDFPIWWKIVAGFIAGFLATLIFHQLALASLKAIYGAPLSVYSMKPTSPFGVPAVFSLAFWGGIWGIFYGLIHQRFPGGAGYWLVAFLFGAVLPTLAALLIVLPVKNMPLAGGWNPMLWLTAFLINGVWGIGTGIFLKFLFHRFPLTRPVAGAGR